MGKPARKKPIYRHALKRLKIINEGHRYRIYARPTKRSSRKCYFLYMVHQRRDSSGKLHQKRKTLFDPITGDYLVVYDTYEKKANDLEVIDKAKKVREEKLDIESNENGDIKIKHANVFTLLDEIMEEKQDKKSENYWRQFSNLENYIHRFMDKYSIPSLRVKDFDRKMLKKFNSFLITLYKSGEIKQSSARQIQLMFNVFLNWIEVDYEYAFPNRNLKIEKSEKMDQPTLKSFDDVKKLFNTPYECNYDIEQYFKFLLMTGIRFSEGKRFKFSDIEQVAVGYGKDTEIVPMANVIDAKSKKLKRIPLNIYANEIVDQLEQKHGDGDSDRRVFNIPTNHSFNEHLRKWVKKAKIKTGDRFGAHVSRRWLSQFVKDTQGPVEQRALMYHVDNSMTNTYAPNNDEYVTKVAMKNERIFSELMGIK